MQEVNAVDGVSKVQLVMVTSAWYAARSTAFHLPDILKRQNGMLSCTQVHPRGGGASELLRHRLTAPRRPPLRHEHHHHQKQ